MATDAPPQRPQLAELLSAYLMAVHLAPRDPHAAHAVRHLAEAILCRLLVLLPVAGSC